MRLKRNLIIAVSVALLPVWSCADRGMISRSQEGDEIQGDKFPLGTVGDATQKTRLNMERVRAWYAVGIDMAAAIEDGQSPPVKLEFALDSPLQHHIATINLNKRLTSSLEKHKLSPTDFIALTVLIGSGWAMLQMRDSLGPNAVLANIDRNLLAFFVANRVALDSLGHVPVTR